MNIQTVTFKETSFIDVTNPGELEMKYLKNNFGFSSLHLEDYMNKTQVPKIESFKDYMLLVLDFPYFTPNGIPQKKQDEKSGKTGILSIPQSTLASVPFPRFTHFQPAERRRRIVSSQVDFFVGKGYLVVLHEGLLSPIDDIFAQCQQTLRNRNEFMGEGPVFLSYRIIDALIDSYFSMMNELSLLIDKIDKELNSDKPIQRTIEDISITRRNLVVFHTIIKPVIPIFSQLEEGKYKELNGSMQPFWGNIVDHLQKIWDRLEDNRELIEGISDSNESLLSFKNNEIVKFLTVITSLSFPFVIVNNLYSMNIVGLPFAQHPGIVWTLFGVIFVSAIGIFFYFKFRKWI